MSRVRGAPLVLLRLEGVVVLAAAVAAYAQHDRSWWLFAALLLTPDLSMLGYLVGPRLGATAYNAVHTYVGPFLLAAASIAGYVPALPSR
jgi:hypothetical protein